MCIAKTIKIKFWNKQEKLRKFLKCKLYSFLIDWQSVVRMSFDQVEIKKRRNFCFFDNTNDVLYGCEWNIWRSNILTRSPERIFNHMHNGSIHARMLQNFERTSKATYFGIKGKGEGRCDCNSTIHQLLNKIHLSF